MAAQEQQREGVVLRALVPGVGSGCGPPVGRDLTGHQILTPAASLLAADLFGHPAAGDLDQPAARTARHALGRPLPGRDHQGVGDCVLGGGEVPVAAGEHADDLRRERAQQVVDGWFQSRHRSMFTARWAGSP
ncbi:hypothetical protein ASE41_16535 [Streptomyces sp. Root264]|nr:hypothetical protein ASE41_16535 [Streptomyces sp. Root264]